jgi:hypothetical protein
VHREHQRRRERGEEEIHPREVPPLAIGVPPPHRQDGEDLLAHRVGLAVAEHRDVRDQPDVEEGARDGEIGEDREDVPDERALEVGPDQPPVRIRDQPEELPRASEVENRKEPGRHDGEDGHRLRASVDRRSEPCAEQVQNGRDQRPRVTNAHPENEGDDVHPPHDGRVVPGDAEARIDLVDPGRCADDQEQDRRAEADEPGDRRMQRADDLTIDLLVVADRGKLDIGRRDARQPDRCVVGPGERSRTTGHGELPRPLLPVPPRRPAPGG